MKTHKAAVLDVIGGIFSDAYHVWPKDIVALGEDLSYLRRAMEQRGLAFFTLTLPALGKVIDRSLSKGRLLVEEFPQGIPHTEKRAKLFGCLFKQVFQDDGMLSQHPSVDAVVYLRQICYLAKRLRLDCSPRAVKETLDEFFAVEARLPPPWEGTWDEDVPSWAPRHGHPLWGDAIREVPIDQLSLVDDFDRGPVSWDSLRALCRRVISEMGTPDWWELRPKHGPGVVSEPKTEFVSKYEFPNWPRKLGMWFPYEWHGSGILDSDHPADNEPPSRLIAVPKSQKGPRLICAEPLAHQWMQQGIWRWLEERVLSSVLGRSIRFRSQQRSREGALDASRSGELCTVDLSAASDRLSCRLVEYVFQGSEVLEGLHACRTRELVQTISPDHPKGIRLRKFAPMGSAVTFPIQSIVFTILSVFALRVAEGREEDWSDWRGDFGRVTVFGDDIIVPTHAYTALNSILTECGLKVNISKSFYEGNFRESCGMDAFMGYNVTPAYLLEPYDGSATSMAATVEASNNFYQRGHWRTAEVIANFLPPEEIKLLEVVGSDDGGLGLLSYSGGTTDHLKVRWNRDLQRTEYIALKVAAKVTKEQGTGLSSLTQYFTERPNPDILWGSGQVSTVRVRKARTRVAR